LSKYQNICIVSAETFNNILKEKENSIMHIQRIIAAPTKEKFSEEDFKDLDSFRQKFIELLQIQDDNSGVKNGNSHCKEII